MVSKFVNYYTYKVEGGLICIISLFHNEIHSH